MSFSGYYQILCKNNHYHTEDAYFMQVLHEWKCPDCQEGVTWWNLIDTTNREFSYTSLAIELRTLTPEQTEKCPCCGHVRVIEEATFEIPTTAGHRVL